MAIRACYRAIPSKNKVLKFIITSAAFILINGHIIFPPFLIVSFQTFNNGCGKERKHNLMVTNQ